MTTATDDVLAGRLQHEVRRLKTLAGTLRALPTLVNVGHLGGRRIVLPADAVAARRTPADAALRADALTRALDRLADPERCSVWLTRGGPLVVGEQDLAWRAAATTASARHGGPDPEGAACFVVTRHGWLAVDEEGAARSWPRLRPGTLARGATLRPLRDEDGVWPVVG